METPGHEGENLEPEEVPAAQPVDTPDPLADSEVLAATEPGVDAAGEPEAEGNAEEAVGNAEEAAGASSEEESAEAAAAAVVGPVRPRNAPRYGAFIGAGIIAGLILALVLFFALPTDGSSSSLTGLLYLAILVTPFTALLGGLAAVLFERRSLRK